MSRAAYELQVLATGHSASCGRPGFVPDDYLEHLDGLAIETTITAVELYAIGMWERVNGGYRVLDREAVEICLDQIRRITGEDPPGPGLGTGTRGPGPRPDGHGDGGNPALRGMPGPGCPHRTGSARRTPRRVGVLGCPEAGLFRDALVGHVGVTLGGHDG
jgi:hypothetical protein